VSHALYVSGRVRAAAQTMSALMQFFAGHRRRFEDIIQGRVTSADPMSRPHVRFNGVTLQESRETWAHAQNDALGIFLWMYCTLAYEGILKPHLNEMEMLTLFPRYFEAIRYWAGAVGSNPVGTTTLLFFSFLLPGLRNMRMFLKPLSAP